MATDATLTELLAFLDQAFDHTSWHGPNLRSSLRGLSATLASWKPSPKRKSIAEIGIHAAYWKYTIRRRLTGAKRGSFPLKGSNWFSLPQPFDDQAWASIVQLLDEQHRALRSTVESLDVTRLSKRAGTSKLTVADLVRGVAAHDLYHSGQVNMLKRMYEDQDETR
jgi:uncharacterized damage-inducible protein DinB